LKRGLAAERGGGLRMHGHRCQRVTNKIRNRRVRGRLIKCGGAQRIGRFSKRRMRRGDKRVMRRHGIGGPCAKRGVEA
jgi:hypothetical protein